jgi:DNA-binding PadR family transcriptional regulator
LIYIAFRYTGFRYKLSVMPKRDRPDQHGPDQHGPDQQDGAALTGFERYAGPATLILSSLADGPKHGYALTKDVAEFAGTRLAPGTLYEALARLESQGLVEAVESTDRRRPYRLTAQGAAALQAHLDAQRRVAEVGLRRLRANPVTG